MLSIVLGCSLGLWSQKPIKVACIGNSITAGYLLNNPQAESYPAVLQQLLGSGYQVGNFGHSGTTLLREGHLPYMQTEEFRKAIAFDADIVIVHLGLNDTHPMNWPNYAQNFVRDYLNLLHDLGINKPGKKFYIATLSPLLPAHPRYYNSAHDYVREINQSIAEVQYTINASRFLNKSQPSLQEQIASNDVTLLHFSEPFYGRWHLFPDALHPNAEGAKLLAEYVYKKLTSPQLEPITLHPYYRDNMIIQKGQIKIVGRATPRHTIIYQLGKDSVPRHTAVDDKGNFTIFVDTRKYQKFDLLITDRETKETLVIHNIRVGEVWIASGQDNMAMTLGQMKDFNLAKAPSDSLLHYIDMQPIVPSNNIQWSLATLDSINAFKYYHPYRFSTAQNKATLVSWSAVAYHFARKLRDSLDCPVAIIHNAVGGSPIESWLEPKILERNHPDILCNWLDKGYAHDWIKERTRQNIALRPKEQSHPYAPSYLYIAGWLPIKDIPHRGVIWFQGESNTHAPEMYSRYFANLREGFSSSIQTFGDEWSLYAVQLPSIKRPSSVYFRNKQVDRSDLYIPSYDLIDSLDIRSRPKATIGHRLALRALERSYNHPIQTAAPEIEYVHAEIKNNHVDIIVFITNAWGGIKGPNKGKPLQGFELTSITGKTIVAQQIEVLPTYPDSTHKGKAMLRLSNLPKEQYVYLSYANEPYTNANIIGGNDMPLIPTINVPIFYTSDIWWEKTTIVEIEDAP